MNTASVTDHWQKMPNINYFSLRFFKRRCTWLREDVWVLAQATHFHNILLSPFHTSESFFTNIRNLQKLPDFTIFYSGKKGASRLGSLVIWCAPKYHKGLEDASLSPGARESCPSCQQNCQMLRNDHSQGHADLLEGLDTTLQPVSFSMVFSVPRSSKFFQGTKHWCPSTEH